MIISHPPFDRLADLAEGLLDAADRTAVERHVSTCSRCADDVAWLIHTIGLMRSDDTESAPEFTKTCTPNSDANNLVGTDPSAPDSDANGFNDCTYASSCATPAP